MLIPYADLIPVIESQLNDDEKAVFNSSPYSGLLVLEAANMAINAAQDRYVSSSLHNLNGDAFRHVTWNAIGAAKTSTAYMKAFADAHETGTQTVAYESTMDYFNNNKGRLLESNNANLIDTYLIMGHTNSLFEFIQDNVIRNGVATQLLLDSSGNPYGYTATNSIGEK